MTKHKPQLFFVLTSLALTFYFAPAVPAAVSVLDYYRLGEDDPGALDNDFMFSTTDSVGNKNLAVVGGPFWSTDVAGSARGHTASVFSFQFFQGGPYGITSVLTSVTDNFGIEAWVKPATTSGNHCIAYNGNTTANGWGLYQVGNTYRGRFAGVSIGSGSVTLNGWTHLALVRTNGVARLYVNGATAGSSSTSVPVAPSGSFAIAAPPQSHTNEFFSGLMDEVRVFTFGSGQFSTADLLVNAPFPPPTIFSKSATSVTSSNATLNATINPRGDLTTVYFQYGTTVGYGSFTSTNLISGSVAKAVSAPALSLVPNTLYHFRAVAWNTSGQTVGPDVTFTTPIAVPQVATLAASNITATGARLNASINPGNAATSFYFQYGTTTNYDAASSIITLAAGTSTVITNTQLRGLDPAFLYHFRVVASNAAGLSFGSDLSFTTLTSSNITVTTTSDFGSGSLRQAIIGAASTATISFAVTGSIVLARSLPIITNSLTINGPGAANLSIDGNNLKRIFFVDAPGNTVTFSNITLANGLARGGEGGSGASGGGGGLGAGGALFVNAGNVVVSGVVFSNNAAIGGLGGPKGQYNGSGGGGGLQGGGGNGGAGDGGGGGGGFAGHGGDGSSTTTAAYLSGGGGGGGLIGNGGFSSMRAGGGGGAIGDGEALPPDSLVGGAGGSGGGGKGGDYRPGGGDATGQAGTINGGGGGGGYGLVGGYGGGNGGTGGKFGGGGGGADEGGSGGAGGDFGGGGGNGVSYYPYPTANGGPGGFGGGGGGAATATSGNGGFGGGSGGAFLQLGTPGDFGGSGGRSYYSVGAGGGGGAALGGAIFVRANNGASLTMMDSVPDAGSVSGGPGGAGDFCSGDGSCLDAEAGGAAGSSMFLLGGTTTLTFNSGVSVIQGAIGGWDGAPAVLIKNGSGTLALVASNSYPGQTLVNAGTLRVDGSIVSSSNVIVNSGATLNGTGSVNTLRLNAGGIISPGSDLGVLTAANTVWAGAGNYNWQLYDATDAAGTGYDVLTVNGALDLSSASGFKINLWTLSFPGTSGKPRNFTNIRSYSWKLVQTTGGIVGFNPANFIINPGPTNGTSGFADPLGGGNFTLTVVGNNLVLNFMVAPSATVQAAGPLTGANATLNGTVDPAGLTTTWYFQYGTTTNYGSTTATNALGSTSNALSVASLITGLTPATLYHFKLVAANNAGTNSSPDLAFTTPVLAPIVSTQPVGAVTANSATLNASVNPGNGATTCYFQYGVTTNYGSFTATNSLPASLNTVAVSNPISGLLPGTVYHARAVAANSSGTVTAADTSFTTAALPPVALTQAATGITSSSATLNASINPGGAATSCYFQYGLTTNYGNFTATNALSAGSNPLAVSSAISGMPPGTLYHFRIVALNSVGTSIGADAQFATLIVPPGAVTLPATSLVPTGATLNATINPGGAPTAYYFQFGLTTSYGSFTPTNSLVSAGSTLQFNGVNQSVSTTQSINLANASFSVEFWAKRDGLNRYDLALVQGTTGVNSHTLHIGWRPSNLFTFAFWGDDLNTPTAYTDSGWHHWACTYDAASRNRLIYRDGIVVASGTAAGNYLGNGPISIAISAPMGTWFGGGLDDLRIWSGVRSAAQIAASLNSQLSGTEPGLLANWKFDEGNGGAAVDATGNGNTGTLVNSPAWLPSGALLNVSNAISGLLPATLYHASVVALNSSGSATGADVSFTTPTLAPTVQTLAATGITSTNAILNASIRPGVGATLFYFQYGPTTNYGSFTTTNSLSAGYSFLAVSNALVNLPPGTLYHFQPVAMNSAGTNFGTDAEFATLIAPPAAVTLPASSITSNSATLNASINAGGGPTAYYFQFGATTDYGGFTVTNSLVPSGSALHFNGTNQSVSTSQSINLSNASFTVEFWAKRDETNRFDLVLVQGTTPTTDHTLHIGWRANNYFTFGFWGDDLNTLLPSNDIGWHHWACAFDAPGLFRYIYRDGVIVAYGPAANRYLGDGPVNIAMSQPTGTWFGGSIDDVRIWSGFRNSVQTAASMNSQLTGNEPGLLANWKFDEGGGGATADATGNGNAGILVNLPDWLPGGASLNVSNAISGLLPATVYHARVVALNSTGSATGADVSFATPPPAPGVQTLPANGITGSNAMLNASINPGGGAASYYFQYGPTTNYGSVTATNSLAPGAASVTVSNAINGLLPGALYHFRVVALYSAGANVGPDAELATLIVSPVVMTLAATGITSTNATLNGTVNPGGAPTAWHFEFGPTTNYLGRSEFYSLVANGSALQFDGFNQSVSTPQSLNLSNASFSVEFWAKRDALSRYDLALAQGSGTAQQTLHIGFRANNVFTFAFWGDDLDTPVAYFDTDWHHWACTYDASSRARLIYRDGVVVASGTAAGNYFGSGPLTIGFTAPLSTWFAGSLDDVRIWSGVRSAAQIAAGLNSQMSGNEPGLLANWKFDEGSGGMTADSTGNGNAGTLVNSPTWLPASVSLSVSFLVQNLLPGKLYHARLFGDNGSGKTMGADITFATPPEAITQPVTGVTRNSSILNASINPGDAATSYYFQYGLDTDYGGFTITNSVSASLTAIAVSNAISGLLPGTLYHARVIADSNSGEAIGADVTFTTTISSPVILTQSTAPITSSNATLNAAIDPGLPTTWYFQYGRTTNYGSFTETNSLPAGDGLIAVSNALIGLPPGTLYHFQAVAMSSAGTNFGPDVEFATLIAPPGIVTLPATSITSTTATLNASVNAGAAPTAWYFQFGDTTNYGSFTATNSLVASGSALHFNGTNQSVSTSQSINLSNSSFSVEFWARRDAPNRSDLVLVQGTTGSRDQTLHIGWRANNRFTFAFWNNDLDTPNAYTDTDWHHWVCTYDASTFNRVIYRDGVVVAASGSVPRYRGNGPVNIAISQPTGAWFGGSVDDVRIWNGVRSADQIAVSMNSQLDGDEPGLVANWKFDEGSGGATADATGNGNTGTLVNSPDWLPSLPSPVTLTGLAPNTTYHFRANALNAAGAASGDDLTFTTAMAEPTVTTLAASAITLSNATLNATIDPGGDAITNYFEYGLTTNYGSFSVTNTLAAGTNPISANATITGLSPGSLYHFRAVAANATSLINGVDLTFTTDALANLPTLEQAVILSNGAFQFGFTNYPGLTFTILGATDPSLERSNWMVLGPAQEVSPGRFQFTDPQATNFTQRFYRLRAP